MRLERISAGFGIWLTAMIMIMLSAYLPDAGFKFLNLAKPHILITVILVTLYSLHTPSRAILPNRSKKLINAKLTLSYSIITVIFTHIAYFLTIILLPREIVEEQLLLINILLPRDTYELFIHIALTWILFAPVEELLFRGAVHTFISSALEKRLAILVSSLLFAAAHLNVIQIPVALVVGATTAGILDKTGNITNSIVVHALNNTVALIIAFYT
ncbi:MAG TPA: CPBP family intramembrane metalloprotease [Candidatus Caldiarchaeum subterraneum]|uniref:CPBP family intramembrane metalloprotease n=1 Tax=Caldiarchaeum subterraneum TaxID=311458 RepID=A0A832ZWC5_CALS0|nr:CPBP family intramembrane metalloprotease [Candidatus Caldarchaeum subterraneum]